MRTVMAFVVVLSSLLLPASASAKGSAPARVCGSEGCVELEGGPDSLIFLDGDARVPAPSPGPYYRLEYDVPGFGPQFFVATGNRLAVETGGGRALQWYALYGTGPESLKPAIDDLEPYPAPADWPGRIALESAPSSGGTGPLTWLLHVGLLVAAATCAVAAGRGRPRTA
jgi:hypothetical protein